MDLTAYQAHVLQQREMVTEWQIELAKMFRNHIMESSIVLIDVEILQAYAQVLADLSHGSNLAMEVITATTKDPEPAA